MAITQAEIAKLAGVSRGTVDRVINKRGHVAPEIEERVKRIAKEMGYERNQAGSMLVRARKTYKLGVIIQSVQTPFMALVLQEIRKAEKRMRQIGVELIVLQQDFIDLEEQLSFLDELEKKEVNGIAITPVESEQVLERISELTKKGIPVVTFNTDLPSSGRLCYVGQDNYLSGRACAGLMNMLLRGQGRVLMLAGYFSNLSQRQRTDGFQSEARTMFPGLSLLPLERGNDDETTCYDIVRRVHCALAEAGEEQIDGIYLAANGQAGVCRALRELEIQHDVVFICHDLIDDTVQGLRDHTIDVVVDQNAAMQAVQPLEILYNYILNGKTPEEEYILTHIDIRTSYNI